MIKQIFNSKGGFTVLESIVAIAVLGLSISGAFAAITQSLSQSTIAKQEVQAFYLAQEAIDAIRNKRDANQVEYIKMGGTVDWLDGITQDDGSGHGFCPFSDGTTKHTCSIDASEINSGINIVECGTDSNWGICPKLRQDTASSYRYGYNAGWTETNFTREIQIESVDAKEIIITVRVHWNKGTYERDFKIKTHLFNWI